MGDTISVTELALQSGFKAADVLRKLWSIGYTCINSNSALDRGYVVTAMQQFGFEVTFV